MASKNVQAPAQGVTNDAVPQANGASQAPVLSKAAKEEPHTRIDSLLGTLNGADVFEPSVVIPKSNILQQTTTSVVARLRESIPVWPEHADTKYTVYEYVDYVAALRLRTMPHHGDKWDRIMLQSVFFASQVHHFEDAVQATLSDSNVAASVIYRCLQTLLGMGPQSTSVLEHAFAVLYEEAFWIQAIHHSRNSLAKSESVQQALGSIFSELVALVSEITIQYYTNDPSSVPHTSSAEFQSLFGQSLASLKLHKDVLINEIWDARTAQIKSSEEPAYDIKLLRRFLAPCDSHAEFLLFRSVTSQISRSEYTCEWFENYLTTFMRSKDRNLMITGKQGCGKSVLANYIVERLRRLQGAGSTDVVAYTIQPDLLTETSTASVARGILVQLLDYNIGGVEMLRFLNRAYDLGSVASPAADIEEVLWQAVTAGLSNQRNVTVVIDGLDHLYGGELAREKCIAKLRQAGAQNTNVRTIILSAPLPQNNLQNAKHFSIETKHIQRDLTAVVRDLVHTSPEFGSLKDEERAKIIEQVAIPADGSFIWAIATLSTIKKQKTVSAILKSLESTTRGVEAALDRLVFSLELAKHETRSILAWMLSAQRPLTLAEIKLLLEVHPTEGTHHPRVIDTEEEVNRAVGDVVCIQDGYVRFIHGTLRDYLLDLAGSVNDLSNSGKFPFMMKEAHFDLSTRCMNYLKLFLTRKAEPTAKQLPSETVADLFREGTLVQYAVRYWPVHFEQSPMSQPDGKHKLVPTFKRNFADSVFLAQLEATCWGDQFPAIRLAPLHNLALFLRSTILGPEHPATLQTTISLANLYQKTDDTKKAIDTYFRVYELASTVLGPHNKLLLDSATKYLDCTRVVKGSKRDDNVTRREAVLKFVIETLKSTSDIPYEDLIKYSTMLAELYANIGEQERAAEIWQDVYNTSIEHYGTFHPHTTKTYNVLVDGLRDLGRHDEVAKLQRQTYDRSRKVSVMPEKARRELAEKLIKYYESRKDLIAAEEMIVDEWQRVSKLCNTVDSIELHSEKMALASHYAEFLHRQSRDAEARTIMLGTWKEYESRSDLRSESILQSLTSVAERMEELEMYETAQSILLTAWNESKISTTESQQHTELTQKIATSLSRSTKKIIESQRTETSSRSIESNAHSSQSSQSIYASQNLEKIMEDIVETTAASKETTAESAAVTASSYESLSAMYLEQERWDDVIRVCTRFLKEHWPSVLHSPTPDKIALPPILRLEVVAAATRLADCRAKTSAPAEAEQLLSSVFRAAKNTLTPTDDIVNTTAQTLITYYEGSRHYSKALTVYIELYTLFREKIGKANPATIEAAYQCARYAASHGQRKDAARLYTLIYESLRVVGKALPESAVEAAQWLEEYHTREKHWKEARDIYQALWLTFVSSGKQLQLSSEYAERLYNSYINALKVQYNAPLAELRDVTVQYRDACNTFYGTESETTAKATFELAKISNQSETHREEAVQLYKQVLDHVSKHSSTSAVSSSLVTMARETRSHLAEVYTSSTSSHKEGVHILTEEYKTSTTKHGAVHRTSLQQLERLITGLRKQDSQESRSSVQKSLETSVTNAVSETTDAKTALEAGAWNARLYLESGNKEAALALLSKLRSGLVFGERSKDLKINTDKNNRVPYAFVAAFEATLVPERQFSDIMSELMTLSLRYQSYYKAIESKDSFEIVCLRGCQLLELLQYLQRTEEYNRIRTDFMAVFGGFLSASPENQQLQAFFDAVIFKLGKNQYESIALKMVVTNVKAFLDSSRFQEAYDLASLELKFMNLHRELVTPTDVHHGLNLALYLSGRGANLAEDVKLRAQSFELAKDILVIVLHASRRLKMHFSTMSLQECNLLAGLLGEARLYSDLERLLSGLWTSREIQRHWSASTVVAIGRSLVEVRFAAGHQASALQLATDILYNLRRVWGELDASTLGMWSLLSELFSVCGKTREAQEVHEEVLRQILLGVEDGEMTRPQGAQLAVAHIEALRRAYLRTGSWARDIQVYKDLQAQLAVEFAQEDVWKKSAIAKDNVQKWKGPVAGETAGLWKEPVKWEFAGIDETATHKNNLRKIAGMFGITKAANGETNGVPKKQYGELSQAAPNVVAK